jgi:hypothetical protein
VSRWGRGDAIPAVKSQCCKRGQASDPDSCASLESSLQRRGDGALLSTANKLRLQTNWDANCDIAIQTGMQTEILRYKLGLKLRYCDTNWDENWDANCETAMPCIATAYDLPS